MSDLDGVWETVANTPMGQQKGTLTLNTEGEALTGTMAGAQGSIAIRDGSVSGNEASWKVDLTNPMPMTLNVVAKVDGDDISGSFKTSFGNFDFKGSRSG